MNDSRSLREAKQELKLMARLYFALLWSPALRCLQGYPKSVKPCLTVIVVMAIVVHGASNVFGYAHPREKFRQIVAWTFGGALGLVATTCAYIDLVGQNSAYHQFNVFLVQLDFLLALLPGFSVGYSAATVYLAFSSGSLRRKPFLWLAIAIFAMASCAAVLSANGFEFTKQTGPKEMAVSPGPLPMPTALAAPEQQVHLDPRAVRNEMREKAQDLSSAVLRQAADRIAEHTYGPGNTAKTVGCSDGTREALVDLAKHKGVAACQATSTQVDASLAKVGGPCGGRVPCAAAADACADGWHLCAGGKDNLAEAKVLLTRKEIAGLEDKGFAVASPLGPKHIATVPERLPEAMRVGFLCCHDWWQ